MFLKSRRVSKWNSPLGEELSIKLTSVIYRFRCRFLNKRIWLRRSELYFLWNWESNPLWSNLIVQGKLPLSYILKPSCQFIHGKKYSSKCFFFVWGEGITASGACDYFHSVQGSNPGLLHAKHILNPLNYLFCLWSVFFQASLIIRFMLVRKLSFTVDLK